MIDDEYFMREALKEAQRAFEAREIPVGAVVVCEGRVVARGHNDTERLLDVTAHAEMIALTAACNFMGSKYLPDCTLYVTLEPCPMCAGALSWAQLGRLVYGAADEKRGFMRFGKAMLHPKTRVMEGVLGEPCSSLLREFFNNLRN